MTDEPNPYAGPAFAAEPVNRLPGRAVGTLAEAWELFRHHCFIIVAAVITVWMPLELFSSYMDHYVFDEDDFRSSFKLARFLDNFLGIIATAAVITVGATATSNKVPTCSGVLSEGLRSWPRLWWTRFLSGLAILTCFLLLVLPGIYVAIRLCLVECAAVVEEVSGSEAMHRSFELTRNSFWYMFRLHLLVFSLLMLSIVVVVVPVLVFPRIDHWIVDACSQLVVDMIAAYTTLCFYCAYSELSQENWT